MRKHRSLFLSLIAAFAFVVAAYGSSSREGISEQDLGGAREVLADAQAEWEGLTPFAYTTTVGFEGINEIDFDADGNVIEERVVFGDPEEQGWGVLPRSVAEAFDVVDGSITKFETGEYEVPPSGECGLHFNAVFDPDTGAPTAHDTLGPCDTGAPLQIVIDPAA